MCTALTLNAKDFYFGRNFDWEFSYGEAITIIPRNYPFSFTDGTNISRHHAIIGTAFVKNDYPLYFDATNEKGLSIAALNFPGNACYKSSVQNAVNIASYELINRILCQFSSAAEALPFLKSINITDASFGDDMPPSLLHWIVADKLQCYVIEQMHDGLKIHQNPFGVLTNNPPFEFHVQNMANFMHITNSEPKNNIVPNVNIKPYSRGMGGVGLPGDWSSASRFVRATFERAHFVHSQNEGDIVSDFFHILSSVMHIRGCVKLPEDEYEITQYSSCCNTDKCIYYFSTYSNSRINAVDMYSENLDTNRLITYPMSKMCDINYINKKQD